MKYLLDTCVISELVKQTPNVKVLDWLGRQSSDSLYVSFITVGEIKKGIVKRGGDLCAQRLARWLNEEILGTFADRILPVDKEVSMEWGRICGDAERVGRRRPAIDALIAATASVHSMTLVTRNVDDMTGMGVPILNPFAGD